MGIVARVVDDELLTGALEDTVQRLAAAPAGAIGRLKALLRAGQNNSLEQQFDLEGRAIAQGAAHPETLAALDAFFSRGR